MRGIVSGNQGYLESEFSKNRGILSECPLRKPYLPDRVMLSPMCSSRFFSVSGIPLHATKIEQSSTNVVFPFLTYGFDLATVKPYFV